MSLKKIAKWVGRRLTEKSTYVGLAAIATAVGSEKLGVQIGQVGQVVSLVLGTGLVAATTSAHPPLEDLVRSL